MTGAFWVYLGSILAAALIAWACTWGYYRAAYGDRYQRGYADGQAAQIRAYQDVRAPLTTWRAAAVASGTIPPQYPYDAYDDDDKVTVLGSWFPKAAGPPRYADLAPAALDPEPETSEWARDLIAGIEEWNAENLPGGERM